MTQNSNTVEASNGGNQASASSTNQVEFQSPHDSTNVGGGLDASVYTLIDFAPFARPRQKYFLLASICFELHFWILLVAVLSVLIPSFIEQGIFVLVSPMLPLMLGSVELFARFRKRFRVNSLAAIRKAKQKPILYLRSFYFERLDKSPKQTHEAEIELYEKENDDEVLALALRPAGPLISIGTPNTSIPPLGAIRLFFKDSEWQQQVVRLMSVSQLVIIQPGYSDGTEWEIKFAKEKVEPERLIYSFLAWQHLSRDSRQLAYEVFSLQIKRIYGCELPEWIELSYFLQFRKVVEGDTEKWIPQRAQVLPLFLIFTIPSLVWRILTAHAIPYPLDIVPRMLRRLPVPRIFRKYNVASVRETLRPVAKPIGIRLPAWRTAAFLLIVSAIAFGLVFANIYYRNPVGSYQITAYDEANKKLFEGELMVTERPHEEFAEQFKGTGTLNILGMGMRADCFSPEEIASKRINTDIHTEIRWERVITNWDRLRGARSTVLVFERKGSHPYEWLARGSLSDGKLFRFGSWDTSGGCFERGASWPGDWQIRRKMPWDHVIAAVFKR